MSVELDEAGVATESDAPAREEERPAATVLNLSNARVLLRPVDSSDYQRLRQLELSSPLAARWRFHGSTPSPDDYARTLWSGVLAQYIIVDRASNVGLGLCSCYGADLANGHAKFAATRFDPDDRAAAFMEGLALFTDSLFRSFPLRKLYLEIPAFNLDTVRSAIGRMLAEEGVLREHVYFDGRYWDQHILALTRESFEDVSARFLRSGSNGGTGVARARL